MEQHTKEINDLMNYMSQSEEQEIVNRNTSYITTLEKALNESKDNIDQKMRYLVNVYARIWTDEQRWSLLGPNNQVELSWTSVKDFIKNEWNKLKSSNIVNVNNIRTEHLNRCIASNSKDSDNYKSWFLKADEIFPL